MLASQLEGDSPRPPVTVGSTHLQDQNLGRSRHLMRAMRRPVRTVAQTLETLPFIACQPAVHRSPGHTTVASHLQYRPTFGKDRLNRLVPLL